VGLPVWTLEQALDSQNQSCGTTRSRCLYLASETWFPAIRCRSRIRIRSRFRNRFRKNRVRTCRSICRCWGMCAAVARQAQEAGSRVFRAKELAKLQASWLRTERQVRKNRARSYMNGSTATANLRKWRTLFLRKLRNSYGNLTDERNSYVLLQRTTAIRERGNGYVTVETAHEYIVYYAPPTRHISRISFGGEVVLVVWLKFHLARLDSTHSTCRAHAFWLC